MFGRKSSAGKQEKQIKNKQAEMLKLVKSTFDMAKWKYDFKPEDNVLLTSFMGDDLPIRMMVLVKELSVQFVCQLDFMAEPGKFKDVCCALNEINKTLSYGMFYLETDEDNGGNLYYEYGLIYVDSNFDESTLASIIKMVVQTVDKHDGDLQKIATKGSSFKDLDNNMFA